MPKRSFDIPLGWQAPSIENQQTWLTHRLMQTRGQRMCCPLCDAVSYWEELWMRDARMCYRMGIDTTFQVIICCHCHARLPSRQWVLHWQESVLANMGYQTPAMIAREQNDGTTSD